MEIPKPTQPRRAFILVVDDEVGFTQAVSGFLEDRGYRVVTAGDGWQALIQAEALNTELVVLDIMMPGVEGSGVDAYRNLRNSTHVRKDLPIIFTTALPPSKALAAFPPEDKKVRVLFKPLNLEDLHKTIKELIGH